MSEQAARSAIAVAVGKDGRVWKSHFGMAPFYWIFDAEGHLLERRENPHARKRHPDDPGRIVDLLPECGTFIGRRMGDESRRRLAGSLGVKPMLVTEEDPLAAVRAYLAGADGDRS